MAPPRRTADPPTDEEWDRRSLEGVDPDSGDVRNNLRKLEAHAGTLIAMAEAKERWTVVRLFLRRFAFATAALLAAMTVFREQVMSWLSFLRGEP